MLERVEGDRRVKRTGTSTSDDDDHAIDLEQIARHVPVKSRGRVARLGATVRVRGVHYIQKSRGRNADVIRITGRVFMSSVLVAGPSKSPVRLQGRFVRMG